MEPVSSSQEEPKEQGDLAPRLRGDPRAGLTAATLGFFVGFAAVALIGPIGTKFKGLMDLSAASLGLLAPSGRI